jgi:hypothetical protein
MRSLDGLVGVHLHLLLFDAFPESLHKHVIPSTAFSVHAHLNAVVGQEPRVLLAGESAPLIGIEDIGVAILRDRRPHAERQKSVVSVFESRQASTRRLAQSKTAKR